MVELYSEKISSPKDAHLAGRKLVLKIAKKKLGKVPEIHIGENGKPYIDGLNFNISHSGEYVVCAFADSAVGVDIEKILEYRPRVAKKFHPEEIAIIEKSENKDLDFLKLWTMKEAYLKMTGAGISKELSFNVLDVPNMHTKVLDGYVLSVCTKKKEELGN